MNFKSIPSVPAFETNMTLTFSPYLFFLSVNSFMREILSGDNVISPVIIAYFAVFLFLDDSGFIVSTFILGRLVFKSDLPSNLVNPNSSKASAIGINPASMYCE